MAASCDENNGSIELELSQEYSDLTYSIDDQLQSVPFFDNLSAGLHNISISKGVDCTLDTSLLVSSDPCPLFIPDAFSPNADGINDEFRIFTSDNNDILVKSYAIFDRWGGHIFNAENFSIHESNHWWDGSVNAKNITQGLYVYVIELVHVDGKHEILKGEVSIL